MSVAWDLLDGVRSALADLDWQEAVEVKVRKRPFHSIDHGDALPLCVVSLWRESAGGYATEGVVMPTLEVLVAVFQRKGSTLQSETELQWLLDRRQAVEDALLVPSLGGLTFADYGYDPAPAYESAGLDKSFDLSLQAFRYTVSRIRG